MFYYADADNDGYGNPFIAVFSVNAPSGYVSNNSDCDDTDMSLSPGTTELCSDGIDNNCDGQIDEQCISVSIGDYYQGGIVFYILQTSDAGYVSGETHGLIADTIDQGTSAWWNGIYISTGTSKALGTGSANTTAIISLQGTVGSYAANICRNYAGSGHIDWYLPSKDELNKLYLNKVLVGGFFNKYYPFNNYYHTSSEEGSGWVWGQDFSNGYQGVNNKNETSYNIRAVRSF